MPCRDYEDDCNRNWVADDLRKQNDKLARIACNSLRAFFNADPATCQEFLDKNKEVNTWWEAHEIADAAAKAEREEQYRLKNLKQNALSKLTSEEKKALGLQ